MLIIGDVHYNSRVQYLYLMLDYESWSTKIGYENLEKKTKLPNLRQLGLQPFLSMEPDVTYCVMSHCLYQ